MDIVGIGCCAVDFLCVVPSHPEPDAKMRMQRLSRQGGGLVATALVAAARLGAETRFVGKVSDDIFGQEITAGLRSEKVDVSRMVIQPGKTSRFAFILVDTSSGGRSIVWTPGDVSPLRGDELTLDVLASCRLLHVDEYEMDAALWAAQAAKDAGITVSVDAETVEPETEKLMSLSDVVIGSRHFARDLAGHDDPQEALKIVRKMGPALAGVTLGEEGSVFSFGNSLHHQQAFKVNVVDTTGAGDVFHGAFAFGLCRGWSVPTSALLASAVSAMKCTGLGGREAIPSLDAVRRFLEDRGHALPA